MKRFKNLLGCVALATVSMAAVAQEKDNRGVNPLSVREINDADVMMKRTLWRRVDLKEKQNQPMFAKGNEITKYIMDAVKAGLLDAYTDMDMTKKMNMDDFVKKLQIPNQGQVLTEEEKKAGFGTEPAGGDGWGDTKKDTKPTPKADDGWGAPAPAKETQPVDDGWGAPTKKKTTTKGKKGQAVAKAAPVKVDSTEIKKKMAEEAAAKAAADAQALAENMYFPDQLSILEVKEDWIFDRKRSRLYYDIQTITMFIPADLHPAGLEMPVATFKYKDLDKLFRSDPKKFIWFNEYNTAQHKNLADAFDLRLFHGRITKTSNPMDRDLISIYGNEKDALWKSVQTENELMELEHGLWEY
ncbi:MAG: gliding motility protein GldN [Spirosomaceae bacterium]|jgi:gliding motility associated protien GldN|nr:gliding motility protein GldN [Spirosomataceae bacterium]